MDYRMLTKLKSTYADGLQKVIGPDGRIRTTFQNTVTATGRLSSTDPNLQNIPVRTELGSEIRRMFVPRPGWVLVDADYSQIELRVLAHIADDTRMQEAFRSGEDFHAVTASQVFSALPLESVTPSMHHHAKAVNFGIVYGISEFSLAQDIGVSRAEAKAYIDSYLEKYSGVRAYMHDIKETAREKGYVETIFGRRRAIPEIKSFDVERPLRCGAHRAQHARAGQRGGHHQAGHGTCVPCAEGAAGPAAAARCTMSLIRRVPAGRGAAGHADRHERDGARRCAAGPARGRGQSGRKPVRCK